jgi:hypothetical protein
LSRSFVSIVGRGIERGRGRERDRERERERESERERAGPRNFRDTTKIYSKSFVNLPNV